MNTFSLIHTKRYLGYPAYFYAHFTGFDGIVVVTLIHTWQDRDYRVLGPCHRVEVLTPTNIIISFSLLPGLRPVLNPPATEIHY